LGGGGRAVCPVVALISEIDPPGSLQRHQVLPGTYGFRSRCHFSPRLSLLFRNQRVIKALLSLVMFLRGCHAPFSLCFRQHAACRKFRFPFPTVAGFGILLTLRPPRRGGWEPRRGRNPELRMVNPPQKHQKKHPPHPHPPTSPPPQKTPPTPPNNQTNHPPPPPHQNPTTPNNPWKTCDSIPFSFQSPLCLSAHPGLMFVARLRVLFSPAPFVTSHCSPMEAVELHKLLPMFTPPLPSPHSTVFTNSQDLPYLRSGFGTVNSNP